jgi:fatty acid synthase subunit alpha
VPCPGVISSHRSHPVHSILASGCVSGLSPAELSARFSGVVWSLSDPVTAVTIFSSQDNPSFLENVQRALKWLFFAGLRGQQLFSALALDPSAVQDSIEGWEGQPTPMLSINGLLLKSKDPQPHISNRLGLAPPGSQPEAGDRHTARVIPFRVDVVVLLA